ncbi:hypothetical protein GE21DRAFT_1340851 [Neurospora crassa]|nr:hypothetical protein 1A9.160 [imported] - Neurospora crassa [Neurospora crassa]KHE88358.1 hypothetical protein GE21DRAFT_1340851 [Neurospora crassa]
MDKTEGAFRSLPMLMDGTTEGAISYQPHIIVQSGPTVPRPWPSPCHSHRYRLYSPSRSWVPGRTGLALDNHVTSPLDTLHPINSSEQFRRRSANVVISNCCLDGPTRKVVDGLKEGVCHTPSHSGGEQNHPDSGPSTMG